MLFIVTASVYIEVDAPDRDAAVAQVLKHGICGAECASDGSIVKHVQKHKDWEVTHCESDEG